MSGDQGSGHAEPDSEGCLLILSSYTETARIVREVADKAGERIMMSPVLGDFTELRFVDAGPAPAPDAEPAAGVACIVDELIRPGGGAGRNYFALVIADRSAAAVDRLLRACGGDPVVAALPLRCRGLASVDDRQPDAQPASGPAADILVSPTGSWRQDDLVDELRRFAESLLEDFASGRQQGLTGAELERLRPAEPDALSPAEKPAPPDGKAHLALPGPSGPPRPERAAPVPQGSAHRPGWLSALGWLWRNAAQPPPGPPRRWDGLCGLVFLILCDEGSHDRAALRRGEAVLLAVNRLAAVTSGVAYWVVAQRSSEDAITVGPRPAGQISQHAFRRPAGPLDLARSLDSVLALLRRDLPPLAEAYSGVVRPALVFYATDTPLADAVTARAYEELAGESSVTWVVSQRSREVMSDVFARYGARIIIDHKRSADEVMSILHQDARQPLDLRQPPYQQQQAGAGKSLEADAS
jgi:hypothetical protein